METDVHKAYDSTWRISQHPPGPGTNHRCGGEMCCLPLTSATGTAWWPVTRGHRDAKMWTNTWLSPCQSAFSVYYAGEQWEFIDSSRPGVTSSGGRSCLPRCVSCSWSVGMAIEDGWELWGWLGATAGLGSRAPLLPWAGWVLGWCRLFLSYPLAAALKVISTSLECRGFSKHLPSGTTYHINHSPRTGTD